MFWESCFSGKDIYLRRWWYVVFEKLQAWLLVAWKCRFHINGMVMLLHVQMVCCVRFRRGKWKKSAESEWEFVTHPEDICYRVVINETVSYETVDMILRQRYGLGHQTPLVISYRLPSWRLEPHANKIPPTTIFVHGCAVLAAIRESRIGRVDVVRDNGFKGRRWVRVSKPYQFFYWRHIVSVWLHGKRKLESRLWK